MNQLPLFPHLLWSVTDLTRYLRDILESDDLLQDLWVQGEISNVSRPTSGHLYFTLKDSGSALKCVMWRSNLARQTFMPRDGQAIEAHGNLSIYEAGGQYQLYADLIRPAGEGLLYQEFLRLKARLEAEGLFDAERKRPIPRWPRRIGIVTSLTGAALRDILNTLRRRYPLAEAVIANTAVQGEDAPAGIVASLQALNQSAHPDVIILARGGGSIEDLWAFNDESVAYAIAASAAPVISGVGHETDFTIADFVSDLRAPTPTAAAELATPNRAELQASLADLSDQLRRGVETQIGNLRWKLERQQVHLQLRSPLAQIRSGLQKLDEFSRRITLSTHHRLQVQRAQLSGLDKHLSSLDPRAVMSRGYAIVSRQDGTLVTSVSQVQPADYLMIHMHDGQFPAVVQEKTEKI